MNQKQIINTQSAGNLFPSQLLSQALASSPAIQTDMLTKEGDVRFTVALTELGLSKRAASQAGLWQSTYVIDLIGEALVRKNLALFAQWLFDLDPERYQATVGSFKHRHFGLEHVAQGRVRFQCHLSLVQQILTEDLTELFTEEKHS